MTKEQKWELQKEQTLQILKEYGQDGNSKMTHCLNLGDDYFERNKEKLDELSEELAEKDTMVELLEKILEFSRSHEESVFLIVHTFLKMGEKRGKKEAAMELLLGMMKKDLEI